MEITFQKFHLRIVIRGVASSSRSRLIRVRQFSNLISSRITESPHPLLLPFIDLLHRGPPLISDQTNFSRKMDKVPTGLRQERTAREGRAGLNYCHRGSSLPDDHVAGAIKILQTTSWLAHVFAIKTEALERPIGDRYFFIKIYCM